MGSSDAQLPSSRFVEAPAFEHTGPSTKRPRTHLTFGLIGLAGGKGRQLVNTASTLQAQLSALAHPHAAPCATPHHLALAPLHCPNPKPWHLWSSNKSHAAAQSSAASARAGHASTSSDAAFTPQWNGSSTSHITQLPQAPPSLQSHYKQCNEEYSEAAPPEPPRQQQRAQVAWARLPFFISSSDPHAAENAAVSYLLYEAEHAELEHAKEAEQRRLQSAWADPPLNPAAAAPHKQHSRRPLRWLKPWSWLRRSRLRAAPLADQGLGGFAQTLALTRVWGADQGLGGFAQTLPPLMEDPKEQALWSVFQQIDSDRNGSIDAKELGVALARLGLPCTREYINEVMSEYDHDHDNSITFSSFKRCLGKREAAIEKAFRSMDTNGDGSISPSELQASLRRSNVPCSSQQGVVRMVELLDADKDATISYDEFRRFACLLPFSQAASTNHMLYAWANSSLWMDQDLTMAHQVSSPDEPSQRLFVGGISGVISRTLIAPIERLRTLMMLSKAPLGFLPSCRSMWADGGFGGLWKGHMSTIIKVFPCSAIQFGVVDTAKRLIRQAKGPGGEVNQLECFLAGCLAGGVACVVSHPLDTIRTQMTVGVGKTPSMLAVARTIGLAGLYRGFNLSLLQEVLGSGIGFLAVDVGCQLYRHWNDGSAPSAQERGLIAALGASIVMTCVMPLDVVVKRLQVQGCPGHPVLFTGPLHAFRSIARDEGLGAFYRGMFTTYMKTAPSMGAVYFFYDRFSEILGIGGLNRYRMAM